MNLQKLKKYVSLLALLNVGLLLFYGIVSVLDNVFFGFPRIIFYITSNYLVVPGIVSMCIYFLYALLVMAVSIRYKQAKWWEYVLCLLALMFTVIFFYWYATGEITTLF